MLIKWDKPGHYLAGMHDVLCILHDVTRNTYHPAFFEELPSPGARIENPGVVRLKSKLHHTEGFKTLDAAQDNLLNDLANVISVPPQNVWSEPREWDGVAGVVLFVAEWLV